MPTTLKLWPANAPLAVGDEPADVPTLTLYRAENPTGSVVIVCPGGGYGNLAPHEAEPVARWLNTLGIAGAVLKYRHAPRYKHPAPLLDVSRAVRLVRASTPEWGLDPHRIGVLGFSAGGHLAATVSTHCDAGAPTDCDPVERVSSRPDLAVLVYPVITLQETTAHMGSRRNLIGEDAPDELIRLLSNDLHVTKDTPPAFLFHGVDDPGVPVANALLYAAALNRAGVSFEAHLFAKADKHGVGLAEGHPTVGVWPSLCATWLKGRGF